VVFARKGMQLPDVGPGLVINLALVKVSDHVDHVNLKENINDQNKPVDLSGLGFVMADSCSMQEEHQHSSVTVYAWNPSTGEAKAGGRKFEDSLGYIVRPYFQKPKNKTKKGKESKT
jgi:hypothetical protein